MRYILPFLLAACFAFGADSAQEASSVPAEQDATSPAISPSAPVAKSDGGFVLYGSLGRHTGDTELEFTAPSEYIHQTTSESGNTFELGLGYRSSSFMFGGVFGSVDCDQCSITYVGATAAYLPDLHNQIKPFVEVALIQQSYEEDGFEELAVEGSGFALAAGVNYEFEHLFFGVKYRAYLFDMTDELTANNGKVRLDAKIDNGKSFLVSVGYRF
jgi:hypothetical protein